MLIYGIRNNTAAYIIVGGCDYYVIFGAKSSFCEK